MEKTNAEQLKAELGAPGAGYRAAVLLFDREFDRRMQEAAGDLSSALGLILEAARSNAELSGAIIFRFLCAFGAEASAAQRVLAMSQAERERDSQELFSDRFQEALRTSNGDLDQACGELLREAFCDGPLNAAVVSNHIAFFREGMARRPRGGSALDGGGSLPN